MPLAADIATGFVAAIHVYILVLEMFLWDTPRGRKGRLGNSRNDFHGGDHKR